MNSSKTVEWHEEIIGTQGHRIFEVHCTSGITDRQEDIYLPSYSKSRQNWKCPVWSIPTDQKVWVSLTHTVGSEDGSEHLKV